MDNESKAALKNAVERGTFKDIQDAFSQHALEIEDSYFDYDILKLALLRGDSEIANYLLSLGCRVTSPNEKNPGETPLHLTVENVKRDIDELVRVLISKGALIYAKNVNGDTPLIAAYKADKYEAVEALLNHCTFRLDPTNKDDIVHFHLACDRNDLRAVKPFVDAGFDPTAPFLLESKEYAGLNPVLYAIRNDFQDLFEILLKKCDLTAKNDKGFTLLHNIYYFYDKVIKNSLTITMMDEWMDLAFKIRNNDLLGFNNYCEDKHGLSYFHFCCMVGNSKLTRTFISNGVNINSPVSMKSPKNAGFTPLHFAVYFACYTYRSMDVIKILLENGADPNIKDRQGRTPLHLVSEEIFEDFDELPVDIIEILLKFEANPAIPDNKGCTPLHFLFKYFYLARYDPDRFNLDDSSIFPEVLLRVSWGSINYTDKKGLSLFHIACAVNHVYQVLRFLNADVDIESCAEVEDYTDYTALHFAAQYKRADIVQELLRRNADVNARTDYNSTPLHLACECNLAIENDYVDDVISNQLKIVRLLLSHGADVHARDWSKFTPLLHTYMMDLDDTVILESRSTVSYNDLMDEIGVRCLETLKILLLNKADVNARTDSQSSILHLMSKYKSLKMGAKIVDYLVISGADVNATDKDGLTPLHVSAKYGNKELVESLLKHDAKPSIKCKEHKIPLQMIVDEIENYYEDRVTSDDISILNALLEYSVDVNVANIASDCCVSELLKHLEQNVDVEDPDVHPEIFRTIFTHVQKLLALGLPLSQSAKSCCARLHSYYKRQYAEGDQTLRNLDNTFNECVNELDRMKDVKIDSYTSLYDILLKTPHELVSHVINDSLKEIINNSEVERDFPKYSCLLKRQYKKGLKRSDVLQLAVEALSKVLKVVLPVPCYEKILKYLDDDDVALLKEVAPVKRNLKRKLSDIITIQSESAPKLKKDSEMP